MTHIVGTVQTIVPIGIGPDAGGPPSSPNTWLHNFAHTPAPSGTKFLLLHFQNVKLPANNRLEVDLGYDTDVFTAADGPQFWTRPINIYLLPSGLVPVRYVTNGASNGGVQLDQYGRGEQHAGETGHPSLSNCDPFQKDAVYVEPTYDPFWYCNNPPNWENAACVPSAGDVRARVARSVGMIISVERSDSTGIMQVSTCSVTLVDVDKVLTAGHCHSAEEALSSSITFEYETDCAGARPAGYSPKFHKVKASLQHRWDNVHDFSLLQLATAPAGIPAIQLRHDIPAVGEQVFGVHHPNGAVKKLSVPHPGFATVTASTSVAINVPNTFHVSGGSSGSGLFDTAGRIVGILSHGAPCAGDPLIYFPTGTFLLDTAPAPPPPVSRDVMLVVDRSGSMSMDDGTGRSKIDAARDAVSLFVELVRAGTGNRVGLVSFSTTPSSPVDFNIANMTSGAKTSLIGPAPYSSGTVGALAPGGATSIGEGLDAARLQFPSPVANPRAILLLTDGLENTPRLVADIEGALSGITVHAIGFGTEASLDGALLTGLTAAHGGLYTRAGSGLALEKFFSHAFGNIFETGTLMDPEFDLPAKQSKGTPLNFRVCGEDTITAVAGWDQPDAVLLLEVTSPGGAVLSTVSPGLEHATGRTWTFLRIKLPHGGERNGLWSVNVIRPSGHGEFLPPAPALRYFINVIPTGGPRLVRLADDRRYYTGDSINPLVMLRYPDGDWPDASDLTVTISRPHEGVGNILTKAGLRAPVVIDADTLPARQATLLALERESGRPVVHYVETTSELSDESADTNGLFEPSGIFGKVMTDLLTEEGNYTFHVRATCAKQCTGMRETAWTIAVAVGIDAGATGVKTEPGGTGSDGNPIVRTTLTPRDRYGNYLGPGRAGDFDVTGQTGTTVAGPAHDNGDGSYSVDVGWSPDDSATPGVIVTQPGRPPVSVPLPAPAGRERYIYNVKFMCGVQDECDCACTPVRPGKYATQVNIHNYLDKDVTITKHVIPVILAGAVAGREPRYASRRASDHIVLPAHTATMDDCCRLAELLLGGVAPPSIPFTQGVLEIVCNQPLDVSAVYTVTDPKSGSLSLEVEQIQGTHT